MPYLWMLLGSFSFACMGTGAYALRDACDWQEIALARSALALVLAALSARVCRVKLVFFQPGILWVRSLAGSISLVCTFYALTRIPQSQVLTLTSMFPLWIVLLSWPLYGERPPLVVWLSIGSSILGVVLMEQPQAVSSRGLLIGVQPAVLAALLGSVATAVAMLGLHRLGQLDTLAIVTHFSSVSVLFCLGVCLVWGPWPRLDHVPQTRTALLLLGVGVAATLGQMFLTRAYAAGAPARVAVVGLTQVVFATLLDVWLWGEHFDAIRLAGMALVVLPSAGLMAERTSARAADSLEKS